ncbi:MAG: amylo-alpha-1,6-glucosidase [Myxococcota bacterium]
MIFPQWFPGRSEKPGKLRSVQKRPRDPRANEDVAHVATDAEWLCTNRRGSFALGTVDRIPRRKYHSLLTLREPGVGEPLNVVTELEDWFEIGDERFALHNYDWGGTVEPEGVSHLVDFEPQPRWTYRFAGLTVVRELWMEEDADAVWLRYAIRGVTAPVRVRFRPLIACRPFHDLAVANPFLNGAIELDESSVLQATIRPYPGLPPLVLSLHGARGRFHADGHWYRGVHYGWERSRGYDEAEDLFTPGEFRITLEEDATLSVRLGTQGPPVPAPQSLPPASSSSASFAEQLSQAGESYLAELDGVPTAVIAGYPWFGEWSRDALISLPGLCLSRGRVREAIGILESLAQRREDALIPNIPASGDVPSNANAIDASLLFIHATKLTAERSRSRRIERLQRTCLELVGAIFEGVDPRVRVDEQGFLFVEQGPWALTWMDAIVDGSPVTPRSGYSVDLNALWLSGLQTTAAWADTSEPSFKSKIEETATKLADHFEEKFWLQDQRFLTDTHDGTDADRKLRPNQLWALALPGIPLRPEVREASLAAVRAKLLTPVGLRTLAPDDPDYVGTYRGSQYERDAAYHQGTVWPWLLGLYADAVSAIEGRESANEELLPILTSLYAHFRNEGCVGQISEVFDGNAPHRPGGAPAQAWSVAEVLRVAMNAEP